MQLGNFSISLNVKDIAASKAFYEKLGFTSFAGDITQNWLIMKSPSCVIGLFQNMFEKNTLTFNPGWDENGEALETFTDIRDIQATLKADGVIFMAEIAADSVGPGHAVFLDPDGNPVMLDQHV